MGERARLDKESEFRFIVRILYCRTRYGFDCRDLDFAFLGVGWLEDIRRAEWKQDSVAELQERQCLGTLQIIEDER